MAGAFALLLVVLAAEPDAGVPIELFSGIHLVNEDEQPYTISVQEPLTAAICAVKRPTARVKNGIASVAARERVEGLEKLPPKPGSLSLSATTRAVLAARARIPCLCAKPCRIQIEGAGAIEAKSGQTIRIRGGKLEVAKAAGGR